MMHSTLNLLTSVSLILSLSGTAFTAPRPRPESPGADGTCSPPVIAVSTATKLKQGPYLVAGARSDANPNGGKQLSIHLGLWTERNLSIGEASFTNQYSISTTYTIGGAFDFSV